MQILLVALVVASAAILISATATNLRLRGIPLGFDFLFRPANFTISETIIAYSPRDPNWWAIVVGLVNTLFVSAIVIACSLVLGLIVGVGRLSSNPLVSGTTRAWVEIARNTPVIILLIFIYSLWWKILPPVREAVSPLPGVHLSLRGLVVPKVALGASWWFWATAAALIPALMLASKLAAFEQARNGRRPPFAALALFAWGGGLIVWGVFGGFQPDVSWPEMGRANFVGGAELTPELTTILLGLIIYTTGFIAEIVRGGILAIGKGQWEAARAVGLREIDILRLVIVPQTLRVIMPPLTSQCINVVKNSTLAIAVGYQDFMTVVGTVINKTSHAVEGIAIILGVFLAVNLLLSSVLNWVNRRFAIVER
jgi:general L-amino acid transport system permease protein